MHDNRIFGGALIVSVVGLLITAHIHPTGFHGAASADAMEHVMRVNVGAHALALVSIWLSLIGLIGLSRHLGIGRPEIIAAMAAYVMAVMAAMSAAIVSGFIMTELARSTIGADESARAGAQLLSTYSHHLNGAYAKVHVAASSLAILLWSVAMLRARFSRVLPFVGFISLVPPAMVLFSGRFHMDVHDLLHVVIAQGVWLAWSGVLLLRRTASAPRDGAGA
jgi:hypothetical protein